MNARPTVSSAPGGPGDLPIPELTRYQLHVIGPSVVEVVDLGTGPLLGGCRPSPDALAAAADLCHRDISVREEVQHALDCGRSEVALWGPTWPTDMGLHGHLDVIEHRLSIAARAFKARARAAAAQAIEPTPVVEVIRSNRTALVSAGTGLPERLPAVAVDRFQ